MEFRVALFPNADGESPQGRNELVADGKDATDSDYNPSEGGDSHANLDDNLSDGGSDDDEYKLDKLDNENQLKLGNNNKNKGKDKNNIVADKAAEHENDAMAEEAGQHNTNHPGDENDENVNDEDEAPIISDDKDDDSSESARVHNDDSSKSAGMTLPKLQEWSSHGQVTGVAGDTSGKPETGDNTLEVEIDRGKYCPHSGCDGLRPRKPRD